MTTKRKRSGPTSGRPRPPSISGKSSTWNRLSRKELDSRILNVFEDQESEESSRRAQLRDEDFNEDNGGRDTSCLEKLNEVHSSDDEEIDEDEAFNSEDEEKFSAFTFHVRSWPWGNVDILSLSFQNNERVIY
jgi:U3 small nucleolar RNA-associated protein 14